MLNKYIFSNTIYNRLNNRDFNIDQNNLDYDFFHNRAALALCVQERFTSIPSRLWQPSSEWPNTELPNYNFLWGECSTILFLSFTLFFLLFYSKNFRSHLLPSSQIVNIWNLILLFKYFLQWKSLWHFNYFRLHYLVNITFVQTNQHTCIFN